MKLKIVDFETAKMLEEIGANFESTGYIATKGNSYILSSELHEEDYRTVAKYMNDPIIPAPTQALAQMWFREVHGINIVITEFEYDWIFELDDIKDTDLIDGKNGFKSYEQALEVGLQKACEIVKDR